MGCRGFTPARGRCPHTPITRHNKVDRLLALWDDASSKSIKLQLIRLRTSITAFQEDERMNCLPTATTSLGEDLDKSEGQNYIGKGGIPAN